MSLIVNEYMCPEHGRFDATVERAAAPDEIPCAECGASSPWVISAPMGKVQHAMVGGGKSDARPHPGVMDTRPLAEGMPLHEWKAKRAEYWHGRSRQEWKEKT